jgi:adenylate cyclase
VVSWRENGDDVSAPIPPEDFAALVGVSLAQVEQWRREGLLDPEGLGCLEELDLVRWLAIHSHEARGYRSDQLAAAIKAGEVHPFMGEFLFPSGQRLGLEEAAERGGVDAGMLRQLRTALGLSGEDIADSWLAQLQAFKTMQAAGLPWEAVLEGARVYGDALRRLAETEVRLVHVHIHERLSASGMPEDEVLRQIGVIEEAVVPLLDGIVQAVHHEHLLKASIEDAYLHLPSSEIPAERGSVETTIVFLDLESFTELTHIKGDELAMETLTRLEGVVRPLALENEGKLVKQIGDGVMLAFRRPDEAVAFARQALDAVGAEPDFPRIHVGIHAGPAIYRAGDYIGSTVNVASRVTGASTAGEILLTDAVASALTDGEMTEPVGVRMLRGAAQPVRLFRVIRRDERRDPVCNAVVVGPPAAQLRRDGEDLWFCSQACLRRFLDGLEQGTALA